MINAWGQVDIGQIAYLEQKFLIENIMYKEGSSAGQLMWVDNVGFQRRGLESSRHRQVVLLMNGTGLLHLVPSASGSRSRLCVCLFERIDSQLSVPA